MKSLTEIKRWATLRCAHCGHRFRWSRDARHATSNRDGKVYHGPCLAYILWRRDAEQRLDVLGWVMEIADLTPDDVKQVLELRMSMDLSTLDQGGKAWRVFNDLSKRGGSQPTEGRTSDG
ncbi:hypothetical protein [Microbacterium luteum]|uniref:hypothetical protein n=1 Tax=Microbacterium luteum TaxID=2782167 RepID=UPI001886C215|nr:hypothetical protein [Microbacterium luteum]